MTLSEIGIIGFLVSAAAEAGHAEFDWYYVLKHAVNLVILIGVLVYFTKDSIKRALENRRTNLGKEIDEAEETIEEATRRYREYTEKLNNIEKEINSLKESIKRQGETERNEMIEQATATADVIRKEARDMMKVEANKAKKELQTDIIQSSLKLAEDRIRQQFSDRESQNTVEQFVRKVEDEKWLQ